MLMKLHSLKRLKVEGNSKQRGLVMLFRKKGKIRKREEDRLISHIDMLKDKLFIQRELVNRSVDPSDEVLLNFKMTEAKYLFLLKEARAQNTNMRKS